MKSALGQLLVLVALLAPKLSVAQTLHEFEEHLKSLFALQDEQREAGLSGMDSLETVDSEIFDYLSKTLTTMPQTLTAVFHLPSGITGLSATSSVDHKVRAWSWDTWTGGSMPQYEVLIQYQSPTGIRVEYGYDTSTEGGNSSWYDTIYSVRTDRRATIYLPVLGSKYSNSDVGQEIDAYSITDSSLNRNLLLFQTPKQRLNSIGFGYNYFSNYGWKTTRERHKIHLEDNGKVLIIPIVKDDTTGGRMTSKSLRYEFDGEHFVYKGISK